MKKIKLLLLILFTFSVLTPLISYTLNNNLLSIEEKPQKTQNNKSQLNRLKNLKTSETWEIFGFIHITGANWSDIEKNYDWCEGSGTLENPYIIKNINIDAGGSGYGILIENSNEYFEITNCKVYNSGSKAWQAGIKLYNTSNGKVINNDCSQNENGIYLLDSYNNTIFGNAASNNNDGNGIFLSNSDGNNVSGNTVNNNGFGIGLAYSNNNNISGNIVNDNEYGIRVTYSVNNIFLKNTASFNDFQGISLEDCENNTISGNTANSNFQNGIYLISSNNNSLSRNTVEENYLCGVILKNSCNNTIWGNLIKYNKLFGIYIEGGQNNRIYFNSIKKYLGNHTSDLGTNNQWDYMGIGNYWNTYIFPDSNNDGIVDSSYIIDDNLGIEDNFPLTESPVHDGEKIHIDDSGVNAWNWSKTAKLKIWCSGSGTEEDPYVITNLIIKKGGWISSILIENSNAYFRIENCQIYNARTAIKLYKTNNGKIINNEYFLNNYGITLDQSNKNDILGNIVNNNIFGIYFEYSNNNTISGNIVNNNEYGIGLFLSYNNTISGNNANINEYGIGLFLSYNNTVFGNILNNNIFGIYLLLSNNNTVSRNTLILNVFFIEEDECIENIIKTNNRCYTTILPSGINDVKIEPYNVEAVDVGMEIALNHETEVVFSAYNDNNIEDVPLDNGLIFINLKLNDTNNLDQSIDAPINFILEFDTNRYIPLNVFWFNEFANDGQGVWEELSFNDLNNGKIFISVNHTSIFAITGVILPIPSSSTNVDDEVYDFLFLILIVFICSLTIITASSTYYYKTRIQTVVEPIKKQALMTKLLPKSHDKKVFKSQNLKDYIENKNLLRIKKEQFENNIELFKKLELTSISDDILKKIDEIDWKNEREKEPFIHELLALSPEERDEIVDYMLKKSKSKNIQDSHKFNLEKISIRTSNNIIDNIAHNQLLYQSFEKEQFKNNNIDLFKKFELTLISNTILKKIDKIDWKNENEKEPFIHELLALTPEERDEIVDYMLKKSKNNNYPS